MKKLLMFAALAVASWLGAVDTALLKYLPAKSAGLGMIEVAKLARHPEIKAALEDPEAAGAFQTLGIAPQDVRDIAVFFVDENDFGVIVRIADGKALKEKLDASPIIKAAEAAVQIAAMDVNGIRVYRCNVQGKNEGIFAAFVAADVLVFVDSQENLEKYLQAPKFDGANAFPHAADVAIWGIWNNPDVQADAKEGQLLSVEATLDIVGEEQQDVVVAAILNCDRDEYAAQLGMTIPGFVQMGCGMAFAEKPELGQKLLEMFKTNVAGKSLKLSLKITPEIAKFLSEYASKAAKESTAAEDNKAPAAQPQSGAPAEQPQSGAPAAN